MRRSLPFAFVLLIGLVVAGLWWFLREPDEEPTKSSGSTTTNEDDAGSSAPDAVKRTSAGPEKLATARFPGDATDPAAKPGGPPALRVRARWPDASPARGVMVSLRGRSRAQGHSVLAQHLTDKDGSAVFTNVPIGKWSVRSDRGDRKTVDYAGGEQEFIFELKGGVRIIGTVVDARNSPVAAASVWLQTQSTDWGGGRVVAETDQLGGFELDQVPTTLSLGAFARGHVPSELIDLDVVDTRSPPVKIRLQLKGKGGNLIGTVTDMDGKAIGGARVAIGKAERHLDMQGDRIIEKWSCRSMLTDESGRFAFDGIPAGPLPVSVLHAGHGIVRDACEITAGKTTELHVEMKQAGTIRGIVTDGEGNAIEGAVLRAYDKKPGTSFIAGGQIDFDKTFGASSTGSAADGSFTLRNLTAGTVHVFAQKGGRLRLGQPVPYTQAELEVAPGAEVEWNPVISDGRTIEGTVYFRDGHVMPNVFITLVDERSNKTHTSTNDREGEFRFVNLDASTYSVRVQVWDAPKGSPPLQKAGIVPDQGRVELIASFDKPERKVNGTVIGVVDDAGGRITNPKAAHVVLMSESNWFLDNGKLEFGVFRFEKVQPCRFRLALVEGETVLGQSDWFELQPGETLDTGTFRTEPGGAIRIKLDRPEGTEQIEPRLYLRRQGLSRGTSVKMGRASEKVVPNLTPGDYAVSGWATGMVSLSGAVTVVAGATTTLSLSLKSGVRCRMEAWFPPEAVASSYEYTITSRDGGGPPRTSKGKLGSAPTRPFPFSTTIPAGSWSVEFSADGKWTARADFDVTADQKEARIRLDLVAK